MREFFCKVNEGRRRQDLILKNNNMADILHQAKQEGRREVVNWLLDVLLGERGLLNRVVAQSQLDQNRKEMEALFEEMEQVAEVYDWKHYGNIRIHEGEYQALKRKYLGEAK